MTKSLASQITTAEIISAVERRHRLPEGTILGKCRSADIADARHIAMYLARALTGRTWVKLADDFDRDHTSVMHGRAKIAWLLKDKGWLYRATVRELFQQLSEGVAA